MFGRRGVHRSHRIKERISLLLLTFRTDRQEVAISRRRHGKDSFRIFCKEHIDNHSCISKKWPVPQTATSSDPLPLCEMGDIVPSICHSSNKATFSKQMPESMKTILNPLCAAQKYLTASRSIAIPPDPHAPKLLPQLPGPARAPPHALLPIRVFLPVAHGPRLPFHAHGSPLRGRRRHFDGVSAVGCVAGVLRFVLVEGFFDGVGGLAFAFEVFGEVLLVSG